MDVNFVSINNFSTIPVLRYIMEDLAKHARITVVNCVIEGQPLNLRVPVKEIAIGKFKTSRDFNQQSTLFKVFKYLSVYLLILLLSFRRKQIFITHDYQVLSILLTLPLFRSLGNRVIYYQFELFEYHKLPKKDRKKVDVIKRNINKLDVCVFPEKHRLEYFCDLTGLKKETTLMIPNSCRLMFESRENTTRLKIPDHAVVMGHIGNVGPDHYIHHFLDAVNKLTRPDVYFLMVGRYSDKVKDLFRSVTNPNFVLMEEVSHKELLSIYPRIDYGFILYRGIDLNFEFCAPNKLYEYWSFGIPVISHKLGGLTGVIKPNLLGRTIDFENGELIPFLQQLITEPKPDRAQIKLFFQEHLSIDHYMDQLRKRILFE